MVGLVSPRTARRWTRSTVSWVIDVYVYTNQKFYSSLNSTKIIAYKTNRSKTLGRPVLPLTKLGLLKCIAEAQLSQYQDQL
jgi:hypothetical protein